MDLTSNLDWYIDCGSIHVSQIIDGIRVELSCIDEKEFTENNWKDLIELSGKYIGIKEVEDYLNIIKEQNNIDNSGYTDDDTVILG